MVLTPKKLLAIKISIHLIQWFFVTMMVVWTFDGDFGADPVQGLSHFSGMAALHTFIATLLISPIAKRFRLGALIRIRRLVGLYCLFWAALHVGIYLALNLRFDWSLMGSELIERPYLVVGFVAFIALLVMGVTSTKTLQSRLGRRWQQIHNTIYLLALLIPLHFWWSVKSGWLEPASYLLMCCGLLWFRRDKIRKLFTLKKPPNKRQGSKNDAPIFK